MSAVPRWVRSQLPGIVAVLLVLSLYLISARSTPSAAETEEAAAGFGFAPQSVAMPSGHPQQEIRQVNQRYRDIDAWISSVGAGVALNDLDGDGLPDDMCVSDPRIDQVAVTPAPAGKRSTYQPFVLNPAPLPMADTMAPMGCTPGDFNEDGRMDVLVYYWGRTPIVFMNTGAKKFGPESFRPVELVPGSREKYTGPQWNSNTVAVDDFDGDGHADIYIGNYFPDGPVLDPSKDDGVAMNRSLSNADNGGASYFFEWSAAGSGPSPTVSFQRHDDVLPDAISHGWDLGVAANDLDGDLLPELYIANDHGTDALLHNRSKPGKFAFEQVYGVKSPTVPKSKRIGADSFKGMGIDFGDFDGDGVYDMFISNITTSFGIQESNLQFVSDAGSVAELRSKLADGEAPWTDRSTELGTAWSGWAWDVKIADFDNGGELEIAQTNGFVKGDVNRWAQLQELATANDLVVEHPEWWPNVRSGDDLAGNQRLHLFARSGNQANSEFVNIAPELGLDVPVPTRGIAIADVDGDGRLDMAVARQWDQPVFYRNVGTSTGEFLGLRLTHAGSGSPVVGAQVKVTTDDGRVLINRLDGGSGHSGKRSTDVHVGLGQVSGDQRVEVSWRDRDGQKRSDTLRLRPGWHDIALGSTAEER